jgi:hypothetical protein
MKLSCLIGRHSPQPSAVKNQGFTFSRCAGCERDLVRSMGRWQTVPKGFRVVWRSADTAPPVVSNIAATSATAETEIGGEGAWTRLATFGALASAGLRAFAWTLGDRIDRLSGRIRIHRRPALLRLPAP